MTREKILEIAEYRGIKELICKSCGTISGPSAVVLEFNGPKVRANCPECLTFIRWLPTHKAWRIFRSAAVGMVEIEKLDNGFLDWYLRNVEKIPEDLRRAIVELIERRTTDPASFIVRPPDIDSKKETELLDRQRFLIAAIEEKKNINRGLVRELDPVADYFEVNKIQNILSSNALIINGYQKELTRVNKNLLKISK